MKRRISSLVVIMTILLSLAVVGVTAKPASASTAAGAPLNCSHTQVNIGNQKWIYSHTDWVDAEYDRHWFQHWTFGFWDWGWDHYDGQLCLR